MEIKNKELALSLTEGGNVGKLPCGVFPEIQGNLKALALGRGTPFLKFFGYSVEVFDRMGVALD